MDSIETKKFESRQQIVDSLRRDRNLAGTDLSELDLHGIKLAGINMKGADLHNSNLSEAKLAGIDMSDVNLSNAQLEKAFICGANLQRANLRGTNFKDAKMCAVNLTDADLTGSDLSQSNLMAVNVSGADFSDVNTTGARAAVKWSDAKVPPDELPEPIPMPPAWLPLLLLGIGALIAFLLLRRRGKQAS